MFQTTSAHSVSRWVPTLAPTAAAHLGASLQWLSNNSGGTAVVWAVRDPAALQALLSPPPAPVEADAGKGKGKAPAKAAAPGTLDPPPPPLTHPCPVSSGCTRASLDSLPPLPLPSLPYTMT